MNAPTYIADPSGEDWSNWLVDHMPGAMVSYLGSHDSDWIGDASNFAAGTGDTVSAGLTKQIRERAGYDDVVNYNSSAYGYGVGTGTAINIGLTATGVNGTVNGLRTLANGARVARFAGMPGVVLVGGEGAVAIGEGLLGAGIGGDVLVYNTSNPPGGENAPCPGDAPQPAQLQPYAGLAVGIMSLRKVRSGVLRVTMRMRHYYPGMNVAY